MTPDLINLAIAYMTTPNAPAAPTHKPDVTDVRAYYRGMETGRSWIWIPEHQRWLPDLEDKATGGVMLDGLWYRVTVGAGDDRAYSAFASLSGVLADTAVTGASLAEVVARVETSRAALAFVDRERKKMMARLGRS